MASLEDAEAASSAHAQTILLANLAILVVVFLRFRAVRNAALKTLSSRAAHQNPSGQPAGSGASSQPQAPKEPPESRFTAEEVADASALFETFGTRREGHDLLINQPGLRFLRRPLSATASAYVTEGEVPCAPEAFLFLWTDLPFRRLWDAGLAAMEELPGGAVYHAIQYPYPLVPRFYLYEREVRRLPDGTILLLAKSAAERLGHLAEEKPGVFCPKFRSYTAIRPVRTSLGAADGSPDGASPAAAGPAPARCEFVMYNLDEQPVPVPSWLLNRLLRSTYPAYMDKVRSAVAMIPPGAERAAEARDGPLSATRMHSESGASGPSEASSVSAESPRAPPVPPRRSRAAPVALRA